MAEYARPEDFESVVYEQWKSSVDANQPQLDREVEDLSWQVAANMWDDTDRRARAGGSVQGIVIPDRPTLSIPKQKQPMAIVAAQFRAAHLGVNIHPVSEDATNDTAEVKQDLYRAIERDSNASQARWWAFDRGSQCGTGWYLVTSEYNEATDDPFDQKIVIKRIFYQSEVFIDQSATMADYSDAEFGGMGSWVPWKTFKRTWPKANLSKADGDSRDMKLTIETIRDQTPDWVDESGDGTVGKRGVRVVRYWHKHYEPEEVFNDEGKARIRQKRTIRWTDFGPGGDDGLEVLEEGLWNGDDIPLIPFTWNELQPFDGERRKEGIVRPSRDGLKLFNLSASELTAAVSAINKTPLMGDVESFEPYMEAWKQSAVRVFPFIPIATVFKGGQMVPPPHRIPVNAEIIQPLMVLLQQADEFIQSTTSTPDSVLGKRNPRAESGKAIQALQGQSEAANSSGIQNFADVTMQYEARVVLGMMKYIYDRPGRVEQVLNPQGEVRSVMLNAPFTMNGRRPVRAQGVAGQTTTMQPGAPPVKHYDLTTGHYGVSITVGKSLPTRVAQDSEQLAAIMEQDPELGVVLAPVFLRQQDGPGMKEAAILAKEYRDRKFGPMGEPKDGQPSPEQLMAKLKAAEGQIQKMEQAGMELQKQVDTDQAKQLAMIEKAKIDASVEQMRIEAELKRAEMDNLARIQVAEIAAGARIDAEQIAAKVAMLIQGAKNAEEDKERQHEARLDLAGRAHEAGMAIHDQERGSEEAQADRDHDAGMAEGEHQRGMESAEHAASLAPDEPEDE